jgi:restriction system protein
LAVAASQDITRKAMTDAMAEHFQLSAAQREETIPSGKASYVRNRVGWAMTFLTKGALIEKVAPRVYRITERGRDFLAAHPNDIPLRDLRVLPGWQEAWGGTDEDQQPEPVASQHATTPLEALDNAIATLNADLKDRLLKAILDQTPTF